MNRLEKMQQNMETLGVEEHTLTKAFPEFESVKNSFIYGEIWEQGKLDKSLRTLITVAVLTTVEGNDLKEQLKAALKVGIKAESLQEVFHQAAPYIGFAKAEKGLKVFKAVLEEMNITLPLTPNGTVTEEDRLEKGIAAQKSIFGESIDKMRASAPEDQKAMQDYLSAYCFGDTYTRGGLELEVRELITFVCIAALGGCDPQMRAHAAGNLAVGNNKEVLIAAIYQCLPYIGFPRTLNAIAAINEVAR